nr:SH3 domain-containing protein [Streptomyces mashuensis]
MAAGAAGGGRAVTVPPGVTAGIAVYDRQTGTFTEQLHAHTPFRSASVVKLLIALDHLWDRPVATLPPEDRERLGIMLRSSDDDAASHYWTTDGGSAIVRRMITRLGLGDTAPPPAAHPGYWGYTALSAADTVTIYRHVLEAAPAAVHAFVMDNLRAATPCGTDGFDQSFGIAAAFDRPRAVKQGWSGFTSDGCADDSRLSVRRAGTAGVDLRRGALHTTGTVGAGDRSIVAVFTLHPDGTPYGKAYSDLSRLTRSLNVPGATRSSGSWFGTWGPALQVRAAATTDSAVLTTLPDGVDVRVGCQHRGEKLTVPPYTNDWWSYLPAYGGYVSNIYVTCPGNRLPDVPECTDGPHA